MITPHLYNRVLGIGEPHGHHFGYFDINGGIVRVASPSSEIIDNLRSFFYPYITSHDETYSGDSFYDIATVEQPELYQYIKENLPEAADDLLPTTLTHDLEYQLRCFHSELREVSIVEDEPLKLFYVVTDRATKIIATVGSRTRTGLLRLIRSSWVLSQPAPIVHSCVLEKDRRGIVIAGDKYAGKTTSLLNLCTRKGYSIVANDRVLLELNRSNERLRATGVPTVVNLRWNTLKPFPKLHHLINVPLFGVSDLAKALDVEITREVEVNAVAFLSYDDACPRPEFRSLSAEDSHELLASHLLSRREYHWVRMMDIGDVALHPAGVAKRDILDGVSCFQLSSNETQLEDSALLLDSWCQLG